MNRKLKGNILIFSLLIISLLASLFSGCTLQSGAADDSYYVFNTSVTEAPQETNETAGETDTSQITDETGTTDEASADSEDFGTDEPEATASPTLEPGESAESKIDENGTYTTKDDVALYIHVYGKLPSNFITKKEAEKLGWSGGSVEKYAPGKCIGGAKFGNYEGLLPEKDGRTYTECDIDTLGASSRGAKRIVFSNDGLIYYTDDHYESFTLLYGEE